MQQHIIFNSCPLCLNVWKLLDPRQHFVSSSVKARLTSSKRRDTLSIIIRSQIFTDFSLTFWLVGCSTYYGTCLLWPWSANTISSWVDCMQIDNWHNPCYPAKSQGEVNASTYCIYQNLALFILLLHYWNILKLGFFFQVSCKVILYVIFYYWANSSSNVWFTLCIWSCLSKLVCKCALQSIVPPQIMSPLMHCLKTWILELLISHWFPMWDFVCPFNLHFKTCYHWQYYFMSKI